MRNLFKVIVFVFFMLFLGVVFIVFVLVVLDYVKIEVCKKVKIKVMGECVGKKVIKVFDLYNEEKFDEVIVLFKEIDVLDDFDRVIVDCYLG